MKRPNSVEEYLEGVDSEARKKLEEIRLAIKEAAPQAEEKISYGMPYYGYKGRLAYFRLAKSHIGLYIPGGAIEHFKKELKDYSISKGATVRLPLDKKVPVPLIKKLVQFHLKENEDRAKKK